MSSDSLTIAIIWGRLTAIAEEMATALSHTAYSDQVREGGDFSCALFDADGRLLAQADRSPAHLGSMPGSVGHMLRYYPVEDLAPGDVVVMNDPHLGAGHLPDLFALSPVYAGEELVGFVCATIHLTDIGGMLPGSQAVVGVTRSIQEGLRLMPTRLYRGGVPNEEILRIIADNVRVPDQVLGDIRAQRSALHVGAQKLSELFERYGREAVDAVAESFLDSSERAVREAIERMPDGTYEFVDHLDDTGPDTEPVRMQVAVTISGSDISFDFAGTGPQTQSGLNSTLSYTRSYCYWVTKAITTQDSIPQNAGQLRPVKVTAPDACFLNAKEPIAVGGRACLNQRIVELLFGALAKAVPDLVHAASGQWVNPIFGGVDPRTGEQFVLYDYILGGVGGRATRDGVDAMSPVFSVENVPIEIQEAQYPVLIERFELMTDSGGAGERRGGLSLRKDMRMLSDEIQLSNLTDRQRFAPYPLEGGEGGALGATILNPGEDEQRLESKGGFLLHEGDLVSFRCAGSAGFGDPRERDRDAVRRDLRDELISADAARSVYGLDDDAA